MAAGRIRPARQSGFIVSKGPDAFRTISEVAEALDLPQHVLRFWETRFAQIKPLKRGGGRRYYRPDDVDLLRGIRQLLYGEGFTIKGVQRILKEQGPRFVISAGRGELDGTAPVAQRAGSLGRAPTADEDNLDREEIDQLELVESDDEDEVDVFPRVDMPVPAGGMAHRGTARAAARPRPTGLSGEEVRVLETTLAELLECRRLLDETD
jgi:DNA-binding transcriptional MerR regulator